MSDENKPLYEICYNDDRASAIYTTHVVDLANKGTPLDCSSIFLEIRLRKNIAISDLEHSSHLGFRSLYTLYGLKVDEKYNAAKQTHKLLERFGKGMNITEEDLRKMNYFSRNHLTPHADFPLAAEQELTYFFQNCVPGNKKMHKNENVEYVILISFI